MPERRPAVADKLGITAPGRVRPQHRLPGLLLRAGNADHAIRAGASRNALVIGAEKLSDITDWTDRSTASSSATAPAPPWSAPSDEPGIGPVVWGSAGDQSDAIEIEGWRPDIQQEGQAVFRWATTALAAPREALRAGRRRPRARSPRSCRTRPTCASSRHRQAAGPARERRHRQATSSSPATPRPPSIPLALSKLVERGEVPSGDPGAALRLRRRPHLRRAGSSCP